MGTHALADALVDAFDRRTANRLFVTEDDVDAREVAVLHLLDHITSLIDRFRTTQPVEHSQYYVVVLSDQWEPGWAERFVEALRIHNFHARGCRVEVIRVHGETEFTDAELCILDHAMLVVVDNVSFLYDTERRGDDKVRQTVYKMCPRYQTVMASTKRVVVEEEEMDTIEL